MSYTPRQWAEQIARDSNLPDEDIEYIELAIVESVREAELALAREKARGDEAEAGAAALRAKLQAVDDIFSFADRDESVDVARIVREALATPAGRATLAELTQLREATAAAYGDLAALGAACEMRDDEYPRKAVERVIAERDRLRERVAALTKIIANIRELRESYSSAPERCPSCEQDTIWCTCEHNDCGTSARMVCVAAACRLCGWHGEHQWSAALDNNSPGEGEE